MSRSRHPRRWLYGVLLVFAVLAAGVVVELRSTYRIAAAPVPADVGDVVAEPGGIRYFSTIPRRAFGSAWGWRPCGSQTDVRVDGSGADVEIDVSVRANVELWRCWNVEDGGSMSNTGSFVAIPGGLPATILVSGVPHAVIDAVRGPVIDEAGWEASLFWSSGGTPQTDRVIRWWTSPSGAVVRVTHPSFYVRDSPDTWLRLGEIAPTHPWSGAPATAPGTVTIAGVDLVAEHWSQDGTTEVILTTEDGRRVLEIEADGMSAGDLLELARSIRDPAIRS